MENKHDAIAAKIENRFGGVSDTLNASLTTEIETGLTPDLIQDIQNIPTAFTGFSEAW